MSEMRQRQLIIFVNAESCLCPLHEGVWGCRSINPLIFNLGIIWRSVVKLTSRPSQPFPLPSLHSGLRFVLDAFQKKHDMDCTYNVTLRHVTETIFAVKGRKRMCVYSLRYAACNTHAPYSLLWPDRLYCIFPQRLTNVTIIGKSSLNTKCVFGFSYNFCLKHSLF